MFLDLKMSHAVKEANVIGKGLSFVFPTNLKKVVEGDDSDHSFHACLTFHLVKKSHPSGSSPLNSGMFHDHPPTGNKSKCWREKRECRRMVIGDDVDIGVILKMLVRTTVARFSGKSIIPSALQSWIDEHWIVELGYCLELHILSQGWNCFLFKTKVDMDQIFIKVWGWGPFGLTLKEWQVNFDPTQDPLAPAKI
jgi:hypothetical protein